MSEVSLIVDIGNPDTWPDAVIQIVGDVVERAPEGWKDHPFEELGSRGGFEEEERQLHQELQEYRVMGYHATRLLPHEINNIRNVTGLQALTQSLRERKIVEAIEHFPDAFTCDPDGETLLSSGPNDWQATTDARFGSIDFVAPFIRFENIGDEGLGDLFGDWGGETFVSRSPSLTLHCLTKASEPAIVELAARVPTLATHWRLLPAFAGVSEDNVDRYWGQWKTTESIPPEFVLDVITIRSNRWPPALHEYQP